MRNRIYISSGLLVLVCMWLSSCIDVAYTYDIESATDDYQGETSNVTVDTALSIDVSMYDQARIFPGLVDTATERRIDTVVRLDLSKQYVKASELGVKWVPRQILATGLYAGAGELVTIHLKGQVMGLTVQVGVHTNDLSLESTRMRDPLIFARKSLFPGENTVRNPYGGYIWIIREENSTDFNQELELEFEGVYAAADYVKGKTDAAAWAQRIKQTTVPWLELQGEHVAFTVPRIQMETQLQEAGFAEGLNATLEAWDRFMTDYVYQFYGLTPGSSDRKYRAPDYPERVVLDAQLKGSVYMTTSGQPVSALYTSDMIRELTDLKTVESANAVAVGSVLQKGYVPSNSPWWKEVDNAASMIPLFRMAEQYFQKSGEMSDIFRKEGEGINELFPEALSYAAADSAKWLRSDGGTSHNAYFLLPLVQLAHYDPQKAWEVYPYIYNAMNTRHLYNGTSNSSFLLMMMCEYYQENFVPFFEHWGMAFSDSYRALAEQFEPMKREIWKYDPLNRENPYAGVGEYDAGKYIYRDDRSAWDVWALNSDLQDNVDDFEKHWAEHMIDGDKSTYWHAEWKNNKHDVPHYVVLDMKDTKRRDGIYIANGTRSYCVRHMIIETVDNGGEDINPYDKNVPWTKVAEIGPFYAPDLDNIKGNEGLYPDKKRNERFFEFINPPTCRYLRLKLPDYSFDFKDWDWENGYIGNEGEAAKFHTIAEFGTFSKTKN